MNSSVVNSPVSNQTGRGSSRISPIVITLGWVSFFTDAASEMVYPLIPLFLYQSLGASPALIGLIDGLAEGISSGLRWLGGTMSDRTGKRKPFVFTGYSISAISKPVMGLAGLLGGWPVFLAGRCLDRLGKAVRSGPRDALIAQNCDPAMRGRAFGLHRAMDTAGAVVGPLLAYLALKCFPTLNLAWIFGLAFIPGAISGLIVAVAVKESAVPPRPVGPPSIFQHFPTVFWHLLLVMGLFSLANSSDMFLLLRCSQAGLSRGQVILAFAGYNIVYAVLATPLGTLSDKLGHKRVIAFGWSVYAAVYLGFAFLDGATAAWLLMGTYGIYQAMSDGTSKALISLSVPKEQRAGAIGLVAAISGFGQLLAGVLFGAFWDAHVAGTTIRLPFACSALIAATASICLLFLPLNARVEHADNRSEQG